MAKMKKMRDWYFEGYEIKTVVKNGKTKSFYGDYKGKYYTLGMDAGGLNRFRIIYYAFTVVYLSAFFFMSLWPSKTASSWPGALSILNLIPIFYLIMGSLYFINAKPEMTVRSMYSSVKTIVRALFGIFIISILTLLSGMIFIFGGAINILSGDGVFLICALVCTGVSAVLNAMWKKHPCEEIKVNSKA